MALGKPITGATAPAARPARPSTLAVGNTFEAVAREFFGVLRAATGLLGGINTYAYALNNPLECIDPEGLAERGGGRKSLGGNDPLIPRDINKNTPRQEVEKAIERIKDAIKRTLGMNQARKRPLEAWMKVAKRGFTKAAACPPILEDLVKGTLEELCSAGDAQACQTYRYFYPDDLPHNWLRDGI